MLGTLRKHEGGWQLQFTRNLAHPPEKVWQALTEAEHLDAWFPTTIEGKRLAGAPLHFSFRNNEGPAFDGEMITYDPPRVLEFTWGEDTLRFELEPAGTGTVLSLLDTFTEHGKAARDAAGWHVSLDALEAELAGATPAVESGDRWAQIHPSYVESFGPEASTVGPPGT